MTATENAVNLSLDVRTPAGSTDGKIELPAAIFGVEPNLPLMHQVVVAQLAAARQGTHATKTRGNVAGGGRKPFRQKGTGRARQGSIRAPHYTGGGTVHGPQPRNYAQRTPKKMIAAALRSALSDRVANDRLFVFTEIVEGQKPSTAGVRKLLASLSERKKTLLVVGREDIAAWKSVANLDNVHPIAPDQLNTYDVLNADDVVFTVEAFHAYVEQANRQLAGSSAKEAAK
ncbi:MAG TPA: 50S ribosomal protein L4 [Dietzia timorensis]|uniref:Large ribosomal subunit protein uL4 n=1 Tax=Dietzia timorensis TaxID=499555 RepID=A0A921F4L7_9ACTN|nr:50S ribosomal protein L4 [Dietzia timorensis]HJE91125.1 50S ribosomal protein L4 [Dietzia timorensis]